MFHIIKKKEPGLCFIEVWYSAVGGGAFAAHAKAPFPTALPATRQV